MSTAGSWWIAARPHTLWAAVVPVLVGGGLAWGDSVTRTLSAVPPAWHLSEGHAFRADAFLAALAIGDGYFDSGAFLCSIWFEYNVFAFSFYVS